MTSAEQASRIVCEMELQIRPFATLWTAHQTAKGCAVIACDKIINQLDYVSIGESGTTKIDYGQSFWNDLKTEIEKL